MTTTATEAEERVYAKVTWRLLPFLGACYLIAYLDRVAAFSDSTLLTVAFVTLASTGGLVSMSLFWSFPGSILVGAGVAAGLAAINSVGNLGGFIGPYLLGGLTDWLGNASAGIAILGGFMVVAGGLIAVTCKEYGLRTMQSSPHGR